MYEYSILDELEQRSNEAKERYEADPNNKVIYVSGIEELTEPFNGSSQDYRAYIYKNYFAKSGPMHLLIIIRETNKGKRGEFALNNVETAIFPLYQVSDNGIEIPPLEAPPDMLPDQSKFIIEHRKRPKKPLNAAFDPDIHKWQINLIAETLQISNRRVAAFCRAMQI